jgi:succinate dehydrogenase / fumarate reductase membrane anchor subunit
MATPLHRVLGLGSAKAGTEHFWLQRLTAVANLVLVPLFVVLAIALSGRPYRAVVDVLSSLPISLLFLALLLSVLIHMRLGMQAIIEDYVHGEWLKLALLAANTLFALLVGIAAALAVIKLAVGG